MPKSLGLEQEVVINWREGNSDESSSSVYFSVFHVCIKITKDDLQAKRLCYDVVLVGEDQKGRKMHSCTWGKLCFPKKFCR